MRSFEKLDCRLMLAGDCNHDEALRLAETTAAKQAAAAAEEFRAADAGATFGTALDLGVMTGSNRYAGAVGGADTSDVMKFTVTANASVALGLSGLRGDIDLSLYNSAGQRIGISNKAGTASESIVASLAPGEYYIVVAPWRTASSNYVLTTSSTLAPTPTTPTPPTPTTPTPTTPTPTTPTSPTSPVTPFADVAYYGGSNDWNLNSINAPEAWAHGYTGQGVVVAVVDTGVDLSHPELSSQLWVNPGEIAGNGIDDDRNGYVDDTSGWDFSAGDNNPDDGNGHGTHVAGIIAADNNGFGTTGVAPDAKIMPVRVLDNNGSGSAQSVAAGIRYAAQNGADIINLSLGGAFSSVIQAAIQYAQQLHVLVVAAAGNSSGSTPGYPARFSASMDNVLSVGAYSSSNQLASFSDRVGNSGAVQVDAPGVGVYSTYGGDRYASLSGTSMATPHVAGLAALALSANPNLSASDLRTLIVNGANRTISGSDSRGGINAALTVALAAAGQVSSSTSTVAAQTASGNQVISIRRFLVSSASVGTPLPMFAVSNVQIASAAPDQQVAPAAPQVSVALQAAHDNALALMYSDDEDASDDARSSEGDDEWVISDAECEAAVA